MERRLALTAAASAAIVVVAGSAAVAANLGILRSAAEEPVGQLDASSVASLTPTTEPQDPVVVTVDEIVEVPVPADDATASPVTDAPAPGSPAFAGGDDDHGDVRGTGSAGPVVAPPPPAPSAAVTTTTARRDDDHEREREHEYEEHEYEEHEEDDD